ncbi:MAG TPA: DUF6677 family protein [Pyrinomonadaceae bacterium]|nr:DUF6677 family protein [Pyrinomonadaceae bacterium]
MAETKDKGRASADAWLVGAAAWAFPGAGHYLQGKWLRGLIITLVVCGMFAIGLAFGGHLFGLSGKEAGTSKLLQLPPTIANLGTGILYLVCWASNSGFNDSAEYAKLATFEYGNTFLLVAGLLNYLGMLDAFDIAVGRKP